MTSKKQKKIIIKQYNEIGELLHEQQIDANFIIIFHNTLLGKLLMGFNLISIIIYLLINEGSRFLLFFLFYSLVQPLINYDLTLYDLFKIFIISRLFYAVLIEGIPLYLYRYSSIFHQLSFLYYIYKKHNNYFTLLWDNKPTKVYFEGLKYSAPHIFTPLGYYLMSKYLKYFDSQFQDTAKG